MCKNGPAWAEDHYVKSVKFHSAMIENKSEANSKLFLSTMLSTKNVIHILSELDLSVQLLKDARHLTNKLYQLECCFIDCVR